MSTVCTMPTAGAALLQPTMPVATHFADQIGIASRHEELRVHRVIMR
jgi:hypothetical protein